MHEGSLISDTDFLEIFKEDLIEHKHDKQPGKNIIFVSRHQQDLEVRKTYLRKSRAVNCKSLGILLILSVNYLHK